MDLDTTIVYDAAEQESDSKDTNPVAPSSVDGAQTSTISDSTAEPTPVCIASSDVDHQLAGADNVASADDTSTSFTLEVSEEDQGECEKSQPGEGEKSQPRWMEESGDWGLNSLFDSPTVHIYAQKRGTSEKGKGKKGYSPVDSTSSRGRQRKVPGHLREYKY